MRSKKEVELIKKLYKEQGKEKNLSKLSRDTKIPRSTIKYILGLTSKTIKGKKYKYKGGKDPYYENFSVEEFLKGKEKEFSFILGAYLGDGHVVKNSRCEKLSIYNNIIDTNVIAEQVRCLSIIFPNNSVSTYKQLNSNCLEVNVNHSKMKEIFNHASGKKHERKIKLDNLQRNIVNKFPKEFLKGLFWSDGSRYLHKQGKYEYILYNFTNVSKDIIDLCSFYLEFLDIDHRINSHLPKINNRSKKWVITTTSRSSKILDTFIGPKR